MLKEYKQVKVSSLNSGLIVDLFELFKFNTVLKQVGIVKQKGHSIIELLLLFMFMILENKKSLYCGLRFIKLSDTSNKNDSCLIFDDTSKEKTGKRTENISWFRNHSQNKYFKGFQNVTAVWNNGISAIVVDFELKIGRKKLKNQEDQNTIKALTLSKEIVLLKKKRHRL